MNIRIQVLTVPVTDNTATVDTNKTWKSAEFTPALSAVKMMWYRNHYLPDPKTWSDTEASPLLFPAEKFAELPPAQILVGELDVLRHEGEEFARKLSEAGVRADVEVMQGMPHRKSADSFHFSWVLTCAAFMAMDAVLDEGKRAIDIMCDSLNKALHSE